MATLHQIEDRIDRERAGAIALNPAPRNMLTIAPTNMSELMEFAKLMCVSGECIPKAFRDKPGACLAIALQAFRTGADPFAVANKAYLVNDRVAYEAQYIHAVINTSGLLKKRLRASYEGEGQTLRCTVRGEIHGEDEPFEYRSPPVAAIPVKNSPLWKGDPEQQLFYYASRAWARRYAPEVILGMDTGEDIESRAIDVTPPPRPRREDFVKPQEPLPTFVVISEQGEAEEFAAAPDAVERVIAMLSEYARAGSRADLEICFDNNDRLIADLNDASKEHLACEIEAHYRELIDELRATAQFAPQGAEEVDRIPPDLSPTSSASHPASADEPPETGEEGAIVADRTSPPVAPSPLVTDRSAIKDGQGNTIDPGAQRIPERATADDPRVKPPEAGDAEDAVDGGGSRSEAAPAERGSGSATSLPRMPGDTGKAGRAGEAGGSPATDIVGELGRKLTAAAQQGQKSLDQAWLRLSEQERDLAQPMRAQYREIAAQVRS